MNENKEPGVEEVNDPEVFLHPSRMTRQTTSTSRIQGGWRR